MFPIFYDKIISIVILIVGFYSFLLPPVSAMAQPSEVDSLLGLSSHVTSWAYFRDPSLSKWYISNPNGITYALGLNNSGHSSWIAIANLAAVANLDFTDKKVSLSSSAAAWTSSDSNLAISLIAGEANEYVAGVTANKWANLISGKTVNMDWYFFRVESTGIWYIIWINETNSTILKLRLNDTLNNYDWKKPTDGSGVAVDTANWTKEVFQKDGAWKVKFRCTFAAFIQNWEGRGIDTDNTWGYQCMDLMHQYTFDVLGFDALHASTAYEAYVDGDGRFDKITNSPTAVPQNGDIIFWSPNEGNDQSGHVAIFIEGNTSRFSSFDQNWPQYSLPHVQEHNWNGVAGWLHPID